MLTIFYTIGFASGTLALSLAGTSSCVSSRNSALGCSTKPDRVSKVHEGKIGALSAPSAGSVIGTNAHTI